MERRYLSVPPEEDSKAQALGARWDPELLAWYIYSTTDSDRFSKWLPKREDNGDEFTITSDQAFVASATVSCWKCHSSIEVICLYCESGTVSGEALDQFTIANVWALEDALVRQLEPWPMFRQVYEEEGQGSYFANHCSHCGAVQEDMYLHSEPGDPFFDIPHAAPGVVKLTALEGRVQLSGDESFEI